MTPSRRPLADAAPRPWRRRGLGRGVGVVGLSLGVSLGTACSLKKAFAPDPPAAGGGNGSGPPTAFSEGDVNATGDVVGYARYCKQELGLAAETLPPWNCLDGAEIPITVEGQPLSAAVYPQLSAHTLGCDLASWLGEEPCSNYAFVQQRQLAPDVKAVLLCRMRSFSTYKDRAARLAEAQAALSPDTFNALYAFDSLGLIWTSSTTGKTCFFDFVGKVYGGYVASPDDEHAPSLAEVPSPKPPAPMQDAAVAGQIWQKNGRGTWRSPAQVAAIDDCVRCHDTGALKASPWINQVFPVPVNDPQLPLLVVGSAFDVWRQRLPVRAISTAPVAGAGGAAAASCTSCHRIGSQATCATHLDFAAGLAAPALRTKLGATFTYHTWMPPAPAAWHGKPDPELTALWTSANAATVARLKCCCANPAAVGCFAQDITASPLPAPVAGTGPATCL